MFFIFCFETQDARDTYKLLNYKHLLKILRKIKRQKQTFIFQFFFHTKKLHTGQNQAHYTFDTLLKAFVYIFDYMEKLVFKQVL